MILAHLINRHPIAKPDKWMMATEATAAKPVDVSVNGPSLVCHYDLYYPILLIFRRMKDETRKKKPPMDISLTIPVTTPANIC